MKELTRAQRAPYVIELRKSAQPGARLRIDSRQVEDGDVFVAVRGDHVDGLRYASVAVARGACCILTETRDEPLPVLPIPVISVPDLKENLGEIAADFYGRVADRMMGLAVTGTNGKTSISHWIARLLDEMNLPCAAIGTIGCFLQGARCEAPSMTTPDAASLQNLLREISQKGARAFAIEASSIGLEQGRMRGVPIHTAVFTNLTQDHLDYHKTFEAYEQAKAILFDTKGLKCAVINADDPAGLRMASRAMANGVRTIVYGLETMPEVAGAQRLQATAVSATRTGMQVRVNWQGKDYELSLNVLGRFNVSNMLAVMATAISLGLSPSEVFGRLSGLEPPQGRLQMLHCEQAALCVVDYAHTPDALEKVLEALREVAQSRQGRLLAVFGAGGDRDRGKRPLMAAVGQRLADRVVITSDNPRTENPAKIAQDMLAGVAGADHVTVELDRRKAIVETILKADLRDIVLVAGKGHEDYQEIQGIKHHFSDAEVVREAFNACLVRSLR